MNIFYVNQPDTWLVSNIGYRRYRAGSKQLLLGQRLHVDMATENNGWVFANIVPNDDEINQGYVERNRLSSRQLLKIIYTDVGQGDAALIEAEGAIIIIDAGPNSGFGKKLKQRLAKLRRADEAVGLNPRKTLHINAVIISHFDKDHFNGITRVIENSDYTFGTIYHNGLPRYGVCTDKDLYLGDLSNSPHRGRAITADLRGLDTAKTLLEKNMLLTKKGNLNQFGKFLNAAIEAKNQGRLNDFKLLVKRKTDGEKLLVPDTGEDIELEVLAPVTVNPTGRIKLQAFPNPHKITSSNPHPSPSASHTINGNSIVLRLSYGKTTFLFGGDLNQPAQQYLLDRYGKRIDCFASDVNKACHHGTSDFDIDYVKAVNPQATVFSSGDDGNYDHPMPDALGAAARHSRGDFPLIFSTELAREVGSSETKYGHINARSNGDVIVMAQKRETLTKKKKWHSFHLPFQGPFHHYSS